MKPAFKPIKQCNRVAKTPRLQESEVLAGTRQHKLSFSMYGDVTP